jgi:hypothetical protein
MRVALVLGCVCLVLSGLLAPVAALSPNRLAWCKCATCLRHTWDSNRLTLGLLNSQIGTLELAPAGPRRDLLAASMEPYIVRNLAAYDASDSNHYPRCQFRQGRSEQGALVWTPSGHYSSATIGSYAELRDNCTSSPGEYQALRAAASCRYMFLALVAHLTVHFENCDPVVTSGGVTTSHPTTPESRMREEAQALRDMQDVLAVLHNAALAKCRGRRLPQTLPLNSNWVDALRFLGQINQWDQQLTQPTTQQNGQ